ncbi:phosphoenolpyruvate--protein phosphotransferase [Nocardia otitidiscaviarum]|uniref:phosphoenolpyruvate--protein phosphotransferase n=1 Tax=Nocardia otitidiscaviarum TaxID=1823 RepID=UPI0004A75D7A|nr:phosphoenolpyruvate--protein phosphotransferase [Nocardia otitidiscaviarum]MBF6137517.1 phosphoenolpyruvate--protein phosphotransferase [Nocardia otitidiscaviarum]MBF6488221.1 phosphoenolpyruvate--protein phosphotransferase [Nocardia otitidiscaviarum]
MTGIVVVSHSRALARSAVALAAEMLHDSPVRIEIAAGLDEHTLGTDATAVAAAITAADSGAGVLILMDLGSAILSAELALDLLDGPHRVRLCAAPLVEGLVAAAVSAAGGADLDEVADEAEHALDGKRSQLGASEPATGYAATSEHERPPTGAVEGAGADVSGSVDPHPVDEAAAADSSPDAADRAAAEASVTAGRDPAAVSATAERERARVAAMVDRHTASGVRPAGGGGAAAADAVRAVFVVTNEHGLHARPAARLVAAVSGRDAGVRVRNLSTGSPSVSGRSLSRIAALGVRAGHEVEITASGPDAQAAVDAVVDLAARHFDERPTGVAASPSAERAATGRAVFGNTAAGNTAAGNTAAGNSAAESNGADNAAVEGAGADSAPAMSPLPESALSEGSPLSAGRRHHESARTGPLAAASGIGIGPAWRLDTADFDLDDGRAEAPAAETEHFDGALTAVRGRIDADIARARTDDTAREIFAAHRLLLDDDDLTASVRARIAQGRSAAVAVAAVFDSAADELAALPDEYQRARAADVRAVRDQLLSALLGHTTEITSRAGVLVAADLTPAQVAGLDRDLVTGIVLAQGSPTAHSAILARTRGIPAVVAAGPQVLTVPEQTLLALDGDTGRLVIDPDADTLAAFTARADAQRARRRAADAAAQEPAVTRDGVEIQVAANVGSVADAADAVRGGADGAGLVRTEFLFLDRADAPTAAEQEQVYRDLATTFGGRPLVLRTLDVGGDKPLPYLAQPVEANPFLGQRGIRLALAHPHLLREQLSAVVRVAADHPIGVMFPMVTDVREIDAGRRMLEEVAPEGLSIEVGIMVEVPATAAKTAVLAEHVDFFSIGTNDLTQYALAVERGNEAVAALADALDPGVLRLIDMVCRGAGGARVAVCGELASDPVAVPILLGLGVTELSVAPAAVPLIKAAVRTLDRAACADLAARALHCATATAVRGLSRPA